MIAVGIGRIIQQGSAVAIISLGTRLQEVQKAAELLFKKHNINCTIADARFAKPIDEKLIRNLAKNHQILVTIEEGSIGGFGSYVNNYLLQNDMFGNNHLIIRNLFIPDLFIEQATQDEQYEECGLNAKQIFSTISEILEMKSKPLSKEKITEQAC